MRFPGSKRIKKETFDALLEDKECFYIYRVNDWTGEERVDDYIIVCNKEIPSDDKGYKQITQYTSDEWFKLIDACSLIPWCCNCLKKKNVIKEHVKLMMATEPLKLRENFYNDPCYLKRYKDKQAGFEYLRNLELSNQILEHHKIVNMSALVKFKNADVHDYEGVLLKLFKKYTDGVYYNKIKNESNNK